MAEMGRMTAAQAVDKLMLSEHADVIRESVRFIVDALMEAEVTEIAGAEFGERAPERRTRQRNGYRERTWDTRVGAIELAIPKLRSGPGYFPSFLEPRRRAEQALVAVVQEAYVNGVSTRKVDRVVEQLGVRMSKDQVSALCRRLDEQVQAFRERPLEGAYPYLWLDAKQEKVRDGALVIAYAVHETGRREVIGLDVGQIESEAFWREFLRSLKRRGLDGVRLCVSDAHEGLKNAIARVLGCPWQRCTVHFVRDMHQHCRPSQRALVSAALREVFNADGYDQARERVTTVIDQLAPTAPKVAELLAEAEEDLLAFYAFPAEHWSKLRSTNPLERVNREIGRRTDVVGIFPNDASLIRLAGMLLIEQNDEWLVGRRYLSQESLAAVVTPETELSGLAGLSPGPASPAPASLSGNQEETAEEVTSALAA
jgi:putative transposase